MRKKMSKIKPTYKVSTQAELERLMETIDVFNKCVDVSGDNPLLSELPALVRLVENDCYVEIRPETESIQEVHIADTPESRAMNLQPLSIDAGRNYILICKDDFHVIVMYDANNLQK
ncbi:hypothetical protein HY485_03325 [Candidatus Woesearchaeota archaeon]|nr:hypothetical protein [Candidatus Woesearchaeota archaeon]